MKSSSKKLTATSNPIEKSSHHHHHHNVHHHNTGKTPPSATRHTTKSDANLFGFKTHIKIYHGFGSFVFVFLESILPLRTYPHRLRDD